MILSDTACLWGRFLIISSSIFLRGAGRLSYYGRGVCSPLAPNLNAEDAPQADRGLNERMTTARTRREECVIKVHYAQCMLTPAAGHKQGHVAKVGKTIRCLSDGYAEKLGFGAGGTDLADVAGRLPRDHSCSSLTPSGLPNAWIVVALAIAHATCLQVQEL
jgi:hypothetical protein